LRDKFTFGAFCKGIDIATPETIAVILHGRLQMLEIKEVMPIERIVEFELDSFFKILNGGQGQGVFHLQVKDKVLYKDGNIISIEELKQILGKDRWLIQEKIAQQHELLNNLYNNSINTVRLMTVNAGSSIKILGALLRMGTKGKRIDNWSAGGVIVPIDKDGSLTKWGFFKPLYGTKVDRHPDSGVIFEGYEIPYFAEAIKQATYFHSLLFGIHSVGWDIAITEKGPVFIEGNDNWDVILYELVNGGSREHISKFFTEEMPVS
jgi:hypothetical protein